ncbi:MAG: BlaI/MecI/CopY family transcriptional regulator [Planctomycetota bacterium]
MARNPATEPTPVEFEILNVLWETGPVSLSQLCEHLRQNRPVATTTVATVLTVMLKKELVTRSPAERGSHWSAKISRQSTAKGMVAKLVDRLFAGSTQSLVAHLIDQEQLTEAQRQELLELLRRGKKGTK